MEQAIQTTLSNKPSEPEIWGVEEAATYCKVKPRTIRLWVSDSERTGIPFFRPKHTRRLRFNAAKFKRWYEETAYRPTAS